MKARKLNHQIDPSCRKQKAEPGLHHMKFNPNLVKSFTDLMSAQLNILVTFKGNLSGSVQQLQREVL